MDEVMKENRQICSSQFFELLDNLTDRFINKEEAFCIGEDLGKDINSEFKDCFSVVIKHAMLPRDILTFSFIAENLFETKKQYVYCIYIDLAEINGALFSSFFSIILAHQMCHFVSFYERFTHLKDNPNLEEKIKLAEFLKNTGAISDTLGEPYNMKDMLETMGKYPKEHFTSDEDSKIDFQRFFIDFLDHLYPALNNR